MHERDKRGGKMGDQDKRQLAAKADLVFTQALIDACERLLELYQQRLAELEARGVNEKAGKNKE